MTLADVAAELYGLAPEQFTATREAAAKQARADGDRDLAAAIHALARPTRTAWLANLLVRRAGDQVAQLMELGEAMRAAQEGLAGDELRRLGAQRHRVVLTITQEARRLAGAPVSDAVARELETTLEAALADPAAAAAVRSGRLVRALAPNGLDPVDVEGAVAAAELAPSVPAGRAPDPRAEAAPAQAAPAPPDRERRRRVEQARRALDDARSAAQAADDAAGQADAALAEAREDEARAAAELAHAEGRLAAARDAHEGAAERRRARQRERDAAAKDARAATHRLTRAEAELAAADHPR